MNATRFGQHVHTVLETFETASLRFRQRGLSQLQADRIGLFLALTLPPLCEDVKAAWAMVDEHFPRTDATPPAGAGDPADVTETQPQTQRT